ncbi:MAG: PqqD family protein [Lachnospiraceae bacterium]|nr:PqqD family protein [Lachnospiraceae bacterium]
MRLSNNYVYHMSHGEAALIPTGDTEFSGLVRGNKTLGVILELLQSDTTEEEMIRKLTERFNVTEETASRDVKRVLSELRKIGAIDE